MDNATMIQAVINTLETIEIKATVQNMEKLTGCHRVLEQLRESLSKKEGDDADVEH